MRAVIAIGWSGWSRCEGPRGWSAEVYTPRWGGQQRGRVQAGRAGGAPAGAPGFAPPPSAGEPPGAAAAATLAALTISPSTAVTSPLARAASLLNSCASSACCSAACLAASSGLRSNVLGSSSAISCAPSGSCSPSRDDSARRRPVLGAWVTWPWLPYLGAGGEAPEEGRGRGGRAGSVLDGERACQTDTTE
jgi:hypothetical protein